MPSCKVLWESFSIHWKTIFIIVWPLALLPVFVVNNTSETRCLYVVIFMAGYWVLEVIPICITALVPIILFPCMGILDSSRTCMAYFKESNMMFIGGLIIALAIEFCNLHTRISLHAIKLIGCSYRRLHLGLVLLTMFVSMWISNTAATAMMIPIIQAVLQELENQGLAKIYEDVEEVEEGVEPDLSQRRPTSLTMGFYISTAYAATIGGFGTVVGSGTNMAFKGIYETLFPESPGIEFSRWMGLNVPFMLIAIALCWIWLQFWFMGLLRPKSKNALDIAVGPEGQKITRQVIVDRLEEMGPFTFHEVLVGLMFVLAIGLWFFRRPGFMDGWPKLLTEAKVGDATAAMIVVLLLFLLPSRSDWIYMWSNDESKRPKTPSPPLVTWRYIHQHMHWSLIFLMGGGFALGEGITQSGLGEMIAGKLNIIIDYPKIAIISISALLALFSTQFTSNVVIANILLPIVAHVSKRAKMHPITLMMPTGMACSLAFMLPVGTPPNAIAQAPCNMPTFEMVKVGVGMEIITFGVLLGVFTLLGPLIWQLDTFPEWAQE